MKENKNRFYLSKRISLIKLSPVIPIILMLYTSDEMIYRLDCERKAFFIYGERNYRCEGKVMEIINNATLFQCSSRCLVVNNCGIINVEKLSRRLNNCQLIMGFVESQDCKRMYAEKWEYYHAIKDNTPMDQKAISCRKGDFNNCSSEEKLNATIYVPFDRIFCNNSFLYTIGRHDNGIMVPPAGDAKLEFDSFLQRPVLVKLTYTEKAIGYFTEHPLNEPNGQDLSIALWIKSKPMPSEYAGYVNSGLYHLSGVYIGHEKYGTVIRFAAFSMKGQWAYDNIVWIKFSDNWMHVALTFSDKDSQLKFYINGTAVGSALGKYSHQVRKLSSSLVIGNVDRASRLAFWNRVLSVEEVAELYKGYKK